MHLVPDLSTPGLRDELVTESLRTALQSFDVDRIRERLLEPGEGAVRVAAHLASVAASIIRSVDSEGALTAEIERVNGLLRLIDESDELADLHIDAPGSLLTGVLPERVGLEQPALPDHPVIPLGEAELLVNAPGQPSIGQLIQQECLSADRVDLLCAFVGPTGVHLLQDAIEDVIERNGPGSVRVITSTWLGATKKSALDSLHEAGAHVYVVYDGSRLRLHAKSWIFHRPGGLSTAYVGSSNLSKGALETGLEWNVRLAQRTNANVLERIANTITTYLADEQFERYDPDRDGERLAAAIADSSANRGPRRLRSVDDSGRPVAGSLRPRPFPFQQRMLDELEAARSRHDRHRNLVVAATGTGKTVIAAFDYARLAPRSSGLPSMLFVAHRGEILEQSRETFRSVLGRPDFGEILGGGRPAPTGKHVFAMVQSLNERVLDDIDPTAYDVVIVDEFHHAEAPTYSRLLDHLEPQELLGLTATPERSDGADVTSWFGGHITSELRLWEAIDRGLLSPFHYVGVNDVSTDLRQARWTRGRYDRASVSNLITGNTARLRVMLRAIDRYVPDPTTMRALGFCVSREHGRWMHEQFTAKGIDSAYVDGDNSPEERRRVLDKLARGDLRCVFSVDVLGEGVDVPDVDTIFLLRPTESATVFVQQLGRGLRLAPGKEVLTVLDLVGVPHERFRFDKTLRTIVDPAGGPLVEQVRRGFPFLPSGCEVHFERDAQQRVLDNLKRSIGSRRWKDLVVELAAMGPDTNLGEFLERSERGVEQVYAGSDRSWGRLRRDAGYWPEVDDAMRAPHKGLYRLLHWEDAGRSALYREWLDSASPPTWSELPEVHRRALDMLLVSVWGGAARTTRDAALKQIWSDRDLRAELVELLTVLDERSDLISEPMIAELPWPLAVHARYSREEVLVALGAASFEKARSHREGVIYIHDAKADAFFVTLRKDERVFSPSTRYRDFALTPTRFHWESQSTTTAHGETGRRYVKHLDRESQVLLFVRETGKLTSGAGAPFTFLGPVRHVSHAGSKPVQITWALDRPMPAELYEVARMVGG